MPRFTQHCTVCPWEGDIHAQPFESPPCPTCGGVTERLWRGQAADVRDDTFIGGLTLENLGHEPVTVGSRSELRRELKARGLEPMVRHVPVPGSDKSPHTTSWAAVSAYSLEQARLLLERVGTTSVTPREPDPVRPQATPELVADVLADLGWE
jgi:hypothetical protein